MNNSRYYYVIIIFILGAALYFSGPWQSATQSVDLAKAGEIARAAQKEAAGVNSYRYESQAGVGDLIKIKSENRVKGAKQLLDIRWNMTKITGNTSVYQDGTNTLILHPLKKKWIRPEEDPTVAPFMEFFAGQLALLNPIKNILQIDLNDKKITIYSGEKAENGSEKTVAIEVIPKPAALVEITKNLPPQLIGADLTDIRQIFWINKADMSVTKYEIRAKVSFFGLKTMEYNAISTVLETGGNLGVDWGSDPPKIRN